MSAETLPLAQVRAKIAGHLARASRMLPDAVPTDVMDPCIEPLVGELEALDHFLHDFGYDRRRAEDQEREREDRVQAKQHHPSVEATLIALDHWAQRLMQTLGRDVRTAGFIGRIDMQRFVHHAVALLERLPARCFEADSPFKEPNAEPVVERIIAALYDHTTQREKAT